MEPLHNALEILNQIVNDEYIAAVTEDDRHFYSSFHFAAQYAISDRTFKRYIGDMRLLGAALYSERSSSGEYAWRCRNWRELRQNGRFLRWLEAERERAAGVSFDAPSGEIEKVCVMNCGPATWDTRSKAERMAACSDCEPARAPNREESKYHFDDEGFNKAQPR